MNTTFRAVTLAVAVISTAPLANAVVLTFDDLTGSQFFTSNYQGFQFGDNNINTTDWYWDTSVNPFNLAFSAPTWVGTACALPPNSCTVQRDSQPIYNATPFTFTSLALSGDVNLIVKAYVGLYSPAAIPAFTIAINDLTAVSKIYNTGNATLINSIVIAGFQGFYALDNLNVTPIPEPETYALMAFGLLAVVGFAAKRNRKV